MSYIYIYNMLKYATKNITPNYNPIHFKSQSPPDETITDVANAYAYAVSG